MIGSFLYETFFIKELVPYIDNNYRTRKNVSARSIIGFSMGGFGALSVSYATVTYLVLLLRYHHLSVQKNNI